MLDAALGLVAEQGPDAASIAGIGGRLGAPTGSIYHRFASRDLLLAKLWLRTLTAFQAGFLPHLADPDPAVAAAGAVHHVLRWSREHSAEARLLLLHRRRDLVREWPAEVADAAATVNIELDAAMLDLTRRLLGATDAPARRTLALAVADLPYAAIRPHLAAGHSPPEHLDAVVWRGAAAILGLDAQGSSSGSGSS